VKGKADDAGKAADDAEVAALAKDIAAAIEKAPLYYTDIAERFAAYNFRTVARALGHLHATEKLWQDPRGRMCLRGSQFAAKPPVK
jgi:2,5-furandicarboxylate decarboxylase 1